MRLLLILHLHQHFHQLGRRVADWGPAVLALVPGDENEEFQTVQKEQNLLIKLDVSAVLFYCTLIIKWKGGRGRKQNSKNSHVAFQSNSISNAVDSPIVALVSNYIR